MQLNLERMKAEYELAKQDGSNVVSTTARKGINEALYRLKKKIEDEERRNSANLNMRVINGVEYQIPACFNWYDEQHERFEVKDGCLYLIRNFGLDSDGSYHLHNYVWIPQSENKYARLLVRILGNDQYGDRYFLEVNYYKHPSDYYPYLNKHINNENYLYKPYYTYVFEKFGLQKKKDSWKNNLLEWINK